MAQTKVVAPVQDWISAANNKSTVLMSTRDCNEVRVIVLPSADAKPAADAVSHPMTRAAPFSMSGLSGQQVWISSGGPLPIDVTVTAV